MSQTLPLALAGGAAVANFFQLAGVYWDVGTHHVFSRESFCTPPHLVIYGEWPWRCWRRPPVSRSGGGRQHPTADT